MRSLSRFCPVFSKIVLVKEEFIVKMGYIGYIGLTSGYQRGMRVVMLINMVIFELFPIYLHFSFWRNLRASWSNFGLTKMCSCKLIDIFHVWINIDIIRLCECSSRVHCYSTVVECSNRVVECSGIVAIIWTLLGGLVLYLYYDERRDIRCNIA